MHLAIWPSYPRTCVFRLAFLCVCCWFVVTTFSGRSHWPCAITTRVCPMIGLSSSSMYYSYQQYLMRSRHYKTRVVFIANRQQQQPPRQPHDRPETARQQQQQQQRLLSNRVLSAHRSNEYLPGARYYQAGPILAYFPLIA